MICRCGHRVIAHRYLFGSGRNTGECLAAPCDCEAVEAPQEAQNGASVQRCSDNVSGSAQNGPSGARNGHTERRTRRK